MKSLTDASLFNLFDRLVARGRVPATANRWRFGGAEWESVRHSFTGAVHGFVAEVTTVEGEGWSLLVVKEYWWAGGKDDALRNQRWAKMAKGKPDAALAWLRRQEKALAP